MDDKHYEAITWMQYGFRLVEESKTASNDYEEMVAYRDAATSFRQLADTFNDLERFCSQKKVDLQIKLAGGDPYAV